MADMEGFSSIISISLSLIQKHEKEYMVVLLNSSALRFNILGSRLQLQSLETLYNISNNEDLNRRIYDANVNVMQELQSLSGRTIKEGLDHDLVDAYHDVYKQIHDVLMDPGTDDIDIIYATIYFKTYFDFVLKSLRELSNCKADQNVPSIEEKLLLLHDMLAYIGDTGIDIMKENRELLKPLWNSVVEASSLLYSCLVCQKEEPMELEIMHNLSNNVNEIFIALLKSPKLQGFMKVSFNAEIRILDIVMRQLDRTSSSRLDIKDVCENLHAKLKFLKTFLEDLPHEGITKNFIHFSPFIDNMRSAAIHICDLCYDKEMKEDLFNELNNMLADLIDQIEDIQVKVEEIKVHLLREPTMFEWFDVLPGSIFRNRPGNNIADKKKLSSIVPISLSLIEEHEKEYKVVLLNNSKLKNCILYVKLWLQSLEAFYKIPNDDLTSNDEDLNRRSIYDANVNVMQELQSLSGRPIEEGLEKFLDNAYDKLKNLIKWAVWDRKTDDTDIIFLSTLFKTKFDFVLKSLGEISNYKANQNAPSIKEKLLLLHDLLAYIGDTVEDITIKKNELLNPLLDSVFKAACFLYSYLVCQKEEMMELEMMHYLSNSVTEIYMALLISSKLKGFMKDSFKREIYLLDNVMRLLDCTSRSRIDLNDVCEKLHDKLEFLKTFITDLPHEVIIENLIHFSPFIENMTAAALHILYLYYEKEMKEDLFIEVNDVLADVIDQIEDIQVEVEEIKVHNAPKSGVNEIMLFNYPKTDPLGFLDLFLGHVGELLKSQLKLITFLKNEIEILKDEFDSLRYLLKRNMEHEGFDDIREQIIQLAYQAEHVIDFYLVKYYSSRRIKFTLSKIIEKMKLIKSEVTRINGKKKYVTRADIVDKTFNNVPSQAIPLTTDVIVGFEDEGKKIMEFLFGDTKKRDVISVVGLPGLGKTTLARKLFEDPLVIKHFDVRAWCTISQTYRKRDVLLTILGDFESTTDFKKFDDEELAGKLRQNLLGRRYLIVIDDLWNIEDWNDLARSFPNDTNRSRIVVTSRLHNVASQTSKVHFLREFSDNESWDLFKKKLFQNKLFQKESFSKDFQEVGIKIVESCKGLPLAIVVIASLLSKEEKTLDKWKEVAANLRSRIFSESESPCNQIFELSYQNLPDNLKSCLLYLGAFKEDEDIPLSKLKRLWIAEGFVRETDAKNLEDLAEEYCMDLISRSLVTPVEERSGGGVKYCCVHDLVHEFCLIKAEEESFLCVDDGSKVYSINDHHRRLIIYSGVSDFFEANPFGYSVRSLLHYSEGSGFVIMNLKLLRVLDFGNGDYRLYISIIDSLIHLRYLSIRADGLTSIPSSISNLWNLRFLRIDGGTVSVSVPDSLWDMVHLRSVNITSSSSFEVHPRRLSNSVLLDNLRTLATPRLCYGEDAENLLRRLSKLQKLSCIFYIKDKTTELPRYPVLDFLDQLTSLKVWFDVDELLQRKHIELNFPSNLKKLKLRWFEGYWDDISRMGRILPNLEVLKLELMYGKDDIWVVEDGDFPELKYLKLNGFNCEEWIASEDCFPVLEKLVLINCRELKEIPPHFGELPTLEMISVDECLQSLCDSVRKVQENQEEWGNDELRVYITDPYGYIDSDGDTKRNSEEHEGDIENNTEEDIE